MRKFEVLTTGGVLDDSIEFRVTNSDGQITTNCVPNTPENWELVNSFDSDLAFSGVEVWQVHTTQGGNEIRWPWRESPCYHYRFGDKAKARELSESIS